MIDGANLSMTGGNRSRRRVAPRHDLNPLCIAGHVPTLGQQCGARLSPGPRALPISSPEGSYSRRVRGGLFILGSDFRAVANSRLTKRNEPGSRAFREISESLESVRLRHGSHREGVRSHEVTKVLQGESRGYC